MDYPRQTARTLHAEHREHLALLGRVEAGLARLPRAAERQHAELQRLLAALAHELQVQTPRHFDFEEQQLFTRMTGSGDGPIAALLTEEHGAMRDVAAELAPLLAAARQGTLDDGGWAQLQQAALELVERQVSHIQKEEMALLPMLEELLDDDTDRQLAMDYAAL
jgi:hemerythrin-like domain-containing protein